MTDNFPLMPPKSTLLRLEHFDETVFDGTPSSNLYKIVDALCGESGAGILLKDSLLLHFAGDLETLYFSDLDYIFGSMNFLRRSEEESYDFDPDDDLLTSDQWDEVKVKDAWYRARVRDFFVAASYGGTDNGIRACVQASSSVNCDVFEVWRYLDSIGITEPLGRAPKSSRDEVVIRPHKSLLRGKEKRLLLQMLDRIMPADTIVTVNTQGLAVATIVPVRSASADSSYFEVQKTVTPTALIDELPPPELLPIDIRHNEDWLFSGSPELAPYKAFNITQEYGYYYLASGGSRSPIDSATYEVEEDGVLTSEENYVSVDKYTRFTPWTPYEKADSPDNYPGGKFGLHPERRPALTTERRLYKFPYKSQKEYEEEFKKEVLAKGGVVDEEAYRLPLEQGTESRMVYTPDLAVAYGTPARESTVTTPWTHRDTRKLFDMFTKPSKSGVGLSAGAFL